MNYELIFVPFDGSRTISGVGMAGNLLIVVNELLSMKADDKVWVDMMTHKAICSDEDMDISNAWEYYFEQQYKTDDGKVIPLRPPRPVNIVYNKFYGLNDNIITTSKNLFYKHFKIKDELSETINEYYNKEIKGKVTLACQVRLGDMLNNSGTPPIESYWRKLNEILTKQTDIEQIFLATDDGIAINYLKEVSPVPIIHQEDIYRTSSKINHKRYSDDRYQHNYRLGKEVLVDILLLGKCDYFLRAKTSSVSTMATILSENVKEIYTT
jgi:hypothetical protein